MFVKELIKDVWTRYRLHDLIDDIVSLRKTHFDGELGWLAAIGLVVRNSGLEGIGLPRPDPKVHQPENGAFVVPSHNADLNCVPVGALLAVLRCSRNAPTTCL